MVNSLNKSIFKSTSIVASVSVLARINRFRNEYSRRMGLKGNKYLEVNDSKLAEYNISLNYNSDILLIFENGLGAPLESWDYLNLFLKDHYNIIRYNRSGYGFTQKGLNNADILEKIIYKHFAHVDRIIFICHSMGALAACNVIEHNSFIKSLTKKIIFIDGTEPDLFDLYRQNPKNTGEMIQISVQKSFAGFFGFQWWGMDKYARRIKYQPDIQESVRLFESNPKEIFAALREYKSIDISSMKEILVRHDLDMLIISSFERKSQQRVLAEGFNIPFYIIQGSQHYSIIGFPDFAWEVASKVRSDLEK